MTPAQMAEIAKDIDVVTKALAKVPELHTAGHQGSAMALALAAAAHVIHGSGSREDFQVLMTAAWNKAKNGH